MAIDTLSFQTVLIVALLLISLQLFLLILLTFKSVFDYVPAALDISKILPFGKKKKEDKIKDTYVEEEVSPGNKAIADNLKTQTITQRVQEIDI